jgi:CBS domain-containing protein
MSAPRHRTVADVMTTRVHVASPTTPFKLLVRLIEENRISAIPIVDQQGFPIGVVSESDLLLKELRTQLESEKSFLHPRRLQTERTKAQGLVASDVMTSPAIALRSSQQLMEAARLMQEHNVRRLVVVDDRGKISGIVSRSDLLQVFLRPDDELRGEMVGILLPMLMLSSDPIWVDVHDNVITLQGEVDRKSDVEILGRWTSELDGVVDVINRLTYRWDDMPGSAVGTF